MDGIFGWIFVFFAKGLCHTLFCRVLCCMRINLLMLTIDIARAYLVLVPNRALKTQIPKTRRKGGRVPTFFASRSR